MNDIEISKVDDGNIKSDDGSNKTLAVMEPQYYRATTIGFWKAAYYCFLGITSPSKLMEANEADAKVLNQSFDGAVPEPATYVIRRAFWFSLIAVLLSMAVGYAAGVGGLLVFGCASSQLIMSLQIVGASVLLWGTLFVCGWQIQTFKGLSLSERVNQWLYRTLYCIGTTTIVCSLAWSPCQP